MYRARHMEAAASGLSVIAGDSGGAPETVEPGRTGFVVGVTSVATGAHGFLWRDGVMHELNDLVGSERRVQRRRYPQPPLDQLEQALLQRVVVCLCRHGASPVE